MAGKISELAALTGATANGSDLIEAVDVSDTSMAATGTNKRMTLTEVIAFLSANGGGGATGTVAAAADWNTFTTTGNFNTEISTHNASAAPEARFWTGMLLVDVAGGVPVSQTWVYVDGAWTRFYSTEEGGFWSGWTKAGIFGASGDSGKFMSWAGFPQWANVEAASVVFTPTGTIAATSVQDAIAEVASEAGGGATGVKLTDLTALTGAGAATTDVLEVVDISDTTMDASGTNKKLSLTELGTWLAANFTNGSIAGPKLTNDSVTNTQLAPMAANTFKGNNTGASAGPTDIALPVPVALGGTGATSLLNNFFLTGTGTTAVSTTKPVPSGNVVGETDSQTLTNKVLTAPIITVAINAQTGTSYTLVLADRNKLITLSNASAITLTVPQNSTVAFAIGTQIDLVQIGAGKVTVAVAGAAVVNATPSLGFRAQYSAASLIKYLTDTWILVGDLA